MLTYCYDHWKQLHKEGLNEIVCQSQSLLSRRLQEQIQDLTG